MKMYLQIVRAWTLKAKNWLLDVWIGLDQKADQKLGFVSAASLSVLGGGIPAWLVSRAIIVAVIASVSGWYVHKYNEGIRETRDKQWVAKLEKEKADALTAQRRAADERQRALDRLEEVWKSEYIKLNEHSKKLEIALDSATKEVVETQKACISSAALDVLRRKAKLLNGGKR